MTSRRNSLFGLFSFGSPAPKKLTLYTSHDCPWAHRVHIALAELGLDFEEVLIDLTVPRPDWYLADINPRGKVPALQYGDEVIIESGIITSFLADAFPSPLLPAPSSPDAALKRARIAFFIVTFTSLITPALYGILTNSYTEAEKVQRSLETVRAVEKEIAPLLEDAGPFFGGSKEVTLAEVDTASWVVRFYGLGKEEHGLFPSEFLDGLRKVQAWQRWADAVLAKQSVTGIWNEAENVKRTKERVRALRAAKESK